MSNDLSARPTARSAFLRILGACGLGLGTLMVSGTVMSALLHGRPELIKEKPWLTGMLNHLPMLAVSFLAMLALSRGRLRAWGFCLPSGFRPGFALLVPAAASVLVSIAQKAFHLSGLTFMEGYTLVQTILLVWLLASVAEELLTRGLIQGFLEPLRDRGMNLGRLRLSAPVLTSGLFFGAMHLMLRTMGIAWPTVITIVLFAVVIGCTAGHFRERTGSLLPAILVHATANVAGTLFDLLASR